MSVSIVVDMPVYPKNHVSDGNIYLVRTKQDGCLFCKTDVSLNADGATRSLSNEKVFVSIDPSHDAQDFYDKRYTVDEIVDYKRISRSF